MQISDIKSGSAEWAKKALAGDSWAKKANGKPETGKIEAAKVSISKDAGQNSSAEALVKARTNALPEIREEKVAVAKERIESGYYNTPEFSGQLATRLVDG